MVSNVPVDGVQTYLHGPFRMTHIRRVRTGGGRLRHNVFVCVLIDIFLGRDRCWIEERKGSARAVAKGWS